VIFIKNIYLNLKRFDIPVEFGGVNRIAPPLDWGRFIIRAIQEPLKRYDCENVKFIVFFPEAHIPGAITALCENSPVKIGCQSVYREDTAPGGNFGAFTTFRTANSMIALGCSSAIIGHCEERRNLTGILQEAGADDADAVDRILNMQALCAVRSGLKVLFCVGETAEQHDEWQETLRKQLENGLKGLDAGQYSVASEPVWAIGPGKTPPGRDYIQLAAQFIKEVTCGAGIVYGGGLKKDNAAMLASIPDIDGGLIALTRFTGEIGFYPDEYLEIVQTYLEA